MTVFPKVKSNPVYTNTNCRDYLQDSGKYNSNTYQVETKPVCK